MPLHFADMLYLGLKSSLVRDLLSYKIDDLIWANVAVCSRPAVVPNGAVDDGKEKGICMVTSRGLPKGVKESIKKLIRPPVPRHIKRNFLPLAGPGREAIAASLTENYFGRQAWESLDTDAASYLTTDEGRADLEDHIDGRLEVFRTTAIPWLDAAKPLAGASILEVGCGTGSSSVALAEQGARVTAVDIDEPSLKVAEDRCALYGVECQFAQANGTEVASEFAGQHFDFVIFFACLEHMTHAERINAMRDTWDMLRPGDLWCVIEAPNRLWYFDLHTALLPFYMWLPDDLAFEYSQFSPRRPFCRAFRNHSEDAMLSFLRHGRGVSFHEFDLAIGKAQELDVVSSLQLRQRRRSRLGLWELAWRLTTDRKFESCLMAACPGIHQGFFQPFLDLIIRKL